MQQLEPDGGETSTEPDRLSIGEIVLDRAARQVWRAGRPIGLTQREFDLLSVLMEHAGEALTRQELLDQVWGKNWIGDPRTLNVHIRWLREKIEDDPSSPRYIRTVRGYGYGFVDPACVMRDA